MLYKIGEFSEITGASIRTLRYYDKIDLFKPQQIDLFTNYRYYSDEQIKDYNIICELKELGFTLDEIKMYWNNFNNDIMLKKKQQLLEESINIELKIKKIDELRSRIVDGKICYKQGIVNSKKVKSLFK